MSFCKFIVESNKPISAELVNKNKSVTIANITQEFELLDGWQIILINVKDFIPFTIHDICIDGKSIEELLLTSWVQTYKNVPLQPFNKFLYKMSGTWKIVLHSDLSVLQERCYNSITSSDYGTNLFANYDIFVDLGHDLQNPAKFNSDINNFFSRPQGLHFYKKTPELEIPFLHLDIAVPTEELLSEIQKLDMHNLHKVESWSYLKVYRNECPEFIVQWLSSIGIHQFSQITVFCLEPYGHLDLHRDDSVGADELNRIHINLGKDEHNQFKFSCAGLVPKGANFTKVYKFAHTVYNESAEPRYSFNIVLDKNSETNAWIRSKSIQQALLI
jgi:hypothetical protein